MSDVYEQWITEPRECVAFIEGVSTEYPMQLGRDEDGVWRMCLVTLNGNSGLSMCFKPLDGRRIWPVRPPSSDDNEPIAAEWWDEIYNENGQMFARPNIMLELRDGKEIELIIDSGETWVGSGCLPHIRTRGDLRRLWLALTGKELGS